MATKEWDQGFMAGVNSALAIVALHDYETVHDEIVQSCGGAALARYSLREGNFDIDGFKRYGYRKDGTKGVRR